ncbi:hypothetical protein H8356DRAFT_1356338 [Neocallimastix lanati (nom. inval.)]|nr:hypothetical protein H8356DRAFT_1356338 [Neocallimastix sp. JGI-2020a]
MSGSSTPSIDLMDNNDVDIRTLPRIGEAKPIASVTSQDVTDFLIEVFSRYGTSTIYYYHPASNELVENRNREIEKKLRNFVEDNENWNLLKTFKYRQYQDTLLTLGILFEEPIQRTTDELLIERFLEHQRTINYRKTRREAKENKRKNKKISKTQVRALLFWTLYYKRNNLECIKKKNTRR